MPNDKVDIAKIREKISKLPQARFLRPEDIEKWIKRTLEIDGERIHWHVARAGGFGGSEMAGLVDSMHGERNFRNTAYGIVSGKMLIIPPSKADPFMMRGTIMEPWARKRFEDKLTEEGRKWRSLDDIQRNAVENVDNKKYPWMRSSLDGLYEVDGEVWIVDFKCPSDDVVNEYKRFCSTSNTITEHGSPCPNFVPNRETMRSKNVNVHIPFDDYIYQLHHYYTDAGIKGVDADRIVLSVFDYQNGADTMMIEIQKDEEVVQELIDAGEFYWNEFVLNGKIPPPDGRDTVVPVNLPENVASAAEKFTLLKVLGSSLDKQTDVHRSEIENWVENNGGLGNEPLKIGVVEVKSKLQYDEDRVVNRLMEHGWTESQIDKLRGPGDYDTKKIKASWHNLVLGVDDVVEAIDNRDEAALLQAADYLKNVRSTVPQKNKGPLEQEKITEALLSCKEDPQMYKVETLSTALTRKNNVELDLIREVVQDLTNEEEILDLVAARIELGQVPKPI